MNNAAVTDLDLQADTEVAIADFPNLKSFLPAGLVGRPRFGLTVDRIREYSEDRALTFWHQLNLPLALHAYRHNPPEVRSLMRSLLKALDDFVSRFGRLPGARSLLSPLWEDPWNAHPELWSIAACVYLALSYQNAGIQVVGFETKIGSSERDADVTVRLNGRVTHVEVEAVHRAVLGGKTDAEVRSELEWRANEKAAKKFGALPNNEAGVVAEVCVIRGEDIERRIQTQVMGLPGWSAVAWMPLRLVGVRRSDGLGFAILPL